jgi:hypothetical protein
VCVWLLLQFLDFFLRGNLSLEKHPRRKPHDWLPVQGWQDLMRLTELAAAKQAPGGELWACLSCTRGFNSDAVVAHQAICSDEISMMCSVCRVCLHCHSLEHLLPVLLQCQVASTRCVVSRMTS